MKPHRGGRPAVEAHRADAQVQVRVTPRRKAAYMRWSRRLGRPLSILVREALDREAGYSEERSA